MPSAKGQLMPKGPHRPATRVILPNGVWILLYDDGSGAMKIGGYGRKMVVTEVTTRSDGAAVYIEVTEVGDAHPPREREADLVTLPRGRARVLGALGG